jgi:hypothetical protein
MGKRERHQTIDTKRTVLKREVYWPRQASLSVPTHSGRKHQESGIRHNAIVTAPAPGADARWNLPPGALSGQIPRHRVSRNDELHTQMTPTRRSPCTRVR